jgi:Tol biopolymer transport system component/tRNA A-37 threonylcarbamoyl transferase component Bud32
MLAPVRATTLLVPPQRFAAHVRHRIEGESFRRGARGEHGDDVRLLQRGRKLDRAREPLGRHSLRELRRKHLDHDVTRERRVARHEHAAHPAAAELAVERVGGAEAGLELLAEGLVGLVGHGAAPQASAAPAGWRSAAWVPYILHLPAEFSPSSQARTMIELLAAALADRYRIDREIGRGGMATVFLAHDIKHDRRVAVKVLHPDLGAVLGGERFLEEVRTTARLQHPHILPLIDSGEAGGLLFYVMPFVDGETLRDRLVRERQLPVADAIALAREIADALEYAHRQGVVHRDVKPENILLADGHALVADFGIARAASRTGGDRLTQTGISLGTPSYMSPEQAMGESTIDARADVYAMGCVLYEMLVGEAPFAGPSTQSIVARLITERAPAARTKRETIPAHVDDAIATALQKLPADRQRSAAEFGAALAAERGSERPPATAPAERRRPRWHTSALVGFSAAALAAAFVAGARSPARTAPPLVFGRSTHVTWDQTLEVLPMLSPDGRSVAYSGGPLAGMRIMIKSVDGGRAQPLTGDSSSVESHPQWSADGSRILFVARAGVYSSPAGGGPPRAEVTGDAARPVSNATYSPDGTRIAFGRADSLFVREADASIAPLARVKELALCSWSPKGTWIACASGNQLYDAMTANFGNRAPSRIVLVRTRDGAVTTVTDSLAGNTSPTWSADERWLYFVSDRDGPQDVYGTRVTSKGTPDGVPVRLTVGLGAHTVSLAGNGKRMAYAYLAVRSSVWSVPTPAHPPGTSTTATRLTNANEKIEEFDVSPDQRWIYYDSDLLGKSQIFRIPLRGGEAEQLTDGRTDEFGPAVSPDGREIAFHSWRSGNRDIFVMNADGTNVRQVTHTPDKQEVLPAWSPDGQALAFTEFGFHATMSVVRRDASGRWGEPVKLVNGGGRGRWSTDGKSIVYTPSRAPMLGVVNAIDGAAHVLVDQSASGGRRVVYAEWGADGQIYYETQDRSGVAAIWSIAPTGGPSREILRFDAALHPATRGTFHVRGGMIYFIGQPRESDVWVMETGSALDR